MYHITYWIIKRPCSLPIKWADGAVDILGIHISKNINQLITINFNRKFAKTDKILQPWRGKHLSTYGKITMINSLVLSQFTYLLMALQMTSFLNLGSKKYFILFGMLHQTKLYMPISIMKMSLGG